MKKNIFRIFLVNFLKAIGVIVLFLGLGIGSYYLTMFYYDKTEAVERGTQYEHVITVNVGNESSNLIYGYDKKTKKIKAMVLELFDQNSKNLTYITIPATTQIEISGETYTEFLKVSQNVPQVAKIANINEYFSGDVAYEYGILMLQEVMDVDMGYFTAMPMEIFDQYFEKKSLEEPVYTPSKKALQEIKSAGDIEDVLEDNWGEKIFSDTTLAQKNKLSRSLAMVNPEFIQVHGVYGEKSGKTFTIDGKKTRKMVNNIWEADEYSSKQTFIKGSLTKKKGKSGAALGKKIWISNGSAINGLAANYQQKLKAEGYDVIGVGNFQGMKQETTTIYAKEKKWAKDFTTYFKNANITVEKELSNGADVEIVLGTDAALE